MSACGFAPSAKPFRDIPRVPSFPVVGSSWIYSRLLGNRHPDERHRVSMELYRKYGPIFVEKLPGRYSLVHLASGNDIRNVYQEEGKEPFRLGATPFKFYRLSRPQYYSDAGILNLQGKKWQKVRSTTQPHTLRVRATKSYVPTMNKIAEDTLDLIDERVDENGEVEDCFRLLQRWALESISVVSVDAKLGSLRSPLDPESDGAAILEDMSTVFECMQKLGYRFPYFQYFRTPTWRRFEKAMDDFTVRIYRHIEEAARRIKQKESDRELTLLQCLLADDQLTFQEVLTFTSDFILAGVDTTSGAATYLLFHLAKNPQAQNKVRQEALALLGDASNSVEQPEPEKLPYLKACLKESLRLNPRVPGIYRKMDHDVVMSGHVVPAGVPMLVDMYVAGRIEENFGSPELFLPERWLRASHETLHHDRYASQPFSFGPRMCLGRRMAELQILLLVAKILLKYQVECDKEDIDFRGRLINIPKHPVNIRFKRFSL